MHAIILGGLDLELKAETVLEDRDLDAGKCHLEACTYTHACRGSYTVAVVHRLILGSTVVHRCQLFLKQFRDK